MPRCHTQLVSSRVNALVSAFITLVNRSVFLYYKVLTPVLLCLKFLQQFGCARVHGTYVSPYIPYSPFVGIASAVLTAVSMQMFVGTCEVTSPPSNSQQAQTWCFLIRAVQRALPRVTFLPKRDTFNTGFFALTLVPVALVQFWGFVERRDWQFCIRYFCCARRKLVLAVFVRNTFERDVRALFFEA